MHQKTHHQTLHIQFTLITKRSQSILEDNAVSRCLHKRTCEFSTLRIKWFCEFRWVSFPWFILGFVPLTHPPDLLRLQEGCSETFPTPRDGFFERHFEPHAGHSESVRGARVWCWLFRSGGNPWRRLVGRASKIPRNMCFCFDRDLRRRRPCSITKRYLTCARASVTTKGR